MSHFPSDAALGGVLGESRLSSCPRAVPDGPDARIGAVRHDARLLHPSYGIDGRPWHIGWEPVTWRPRDGRVRTFGSQIPGASGSDARHQFDRWDFHSAHCRRRRNTCTRCTCACRHGTGYCSSGPGGRSGMRSAGAGPADRAGTASRPGRRVGSGVSTNVTPSSVARAKSGSDINWSQQPARHTPRAKHPSPERLPRCRVLLSEDWEGGQTGL